MIPVLNTLTGELIQVVPVCLGVLGWGNLMQM